jgi:hypothetical protein
VQVHAGHHSKTKAKRKRKKRVHFGFASRPPPPLPYILTSFLCTVGLSWILSLHTKKESVFFIEIDRERERESAKNMNEKANVSKELNAKHRKVSSLYSFSF